ncbi:ABC transporter ATP-binding protein [Halomonas sp. BMC6]|uniref:ABC transporter ATP-binding protein n=1 Tax=Halomonas sp. BMC6 TaxID=3073244 RepID=UPI0030D0004E
MSGREGQAVHRAHIRALMRALASEVLWPFRWRVLTILLMQVATQVLLLASLVLPWQLLQVLMTGQSRLTGWMPCIHSDQDQIAILLALAVFCFCAYALLQWLIRHAIAHFASAILQSLNKTRLVANHRLLGNRVLTVVLNALSSSVIALLFCCVIALLHPLLALLAAICVLILTAVVMHYYRYEKVQIIQDTLQSNVLTVINISFALGFSILVLDYLYGSVRPLLTLFILLISMRQMMAASLNGLVNFLGVIKHFQSINMLLLPRDRHVSLLETTDFVKRFESNTLPQWLTAWIAERYGHHMSYHIIECRLLHGRSVAQVLIQVIDESDCTHYWLLKCYKPSRENEALHESALLTEVGGYRMDTQLTVPILCDHGRLPWCYYLLLEMGEQQPRWLNSEERKPWMAALRQTLMKMPLSHALHTQYMATFASLPERMKKIEAKHFGYLTHDDQQAFQVEPFMQRWPHIIAAVEKVPYCLTLHNPSSARFAMLETHPLLLDWQGWSYDSLGAHWPLSAKLYKEVLKVVSAQWAQLSERQEWLALSSPERASHHIALAARAHEFCQRCQTHNDSGALNMLNGIIKAYDAMSGVNT